MAHTQTPVILLTGFLGSGKTTFINWILQNHPDIMISVLINEFGDIKLESQFIKSHSGEVIELTNGCMCCVAKADIPHAINYILDNSPATQYLLVEASGLSDPDPIRAVLSGPDLGNKIRFDANICIVDAVNFESSRQNHPIVLSQVGDADIIVLSKVQNINTDQVENLKKTLRAIIPGIRIIEFANDLSPHLFLDPNFLHQSSQLKKPNSSHEHKHENYQTFIFKSVKPLDQTKITEVLNSLPETIMRAKGYLNIKDQEHKVLLQHVGSRTELLYEKWKPDDKKSTAILFIGTTFDQEKLESTLNSCTT